ncbi:MAG: chromosome segregation protein ScpA [Candidatus Omnitrophica bacterium]|nr:chromosome segregation protein ScpA [Candidatus Omnitrophota bacterium]
MTYKVKLDVFEGPLDLLLFLIKKEEIDIYDIPIAEITDQYLEYLELMKMLDLNIAGEFLVMAATLMHIKSRMLLPPEELTPEEEEQEDPRVELVRKLLEYKKFKEAASELAKRELTERNVFTRQFSEGATEEEGQYFEASLFDLISAFSKVLKKLPKEIFYEIIKDEFTIEEKIHEIFHRLINEPVLYFTQLFNNSKSKLEVIITFLAVLELIRLREILIRQEILFGEIQIVRNTKKIEPTIRMP